jgi:O-antigen ligase
VTATDPPDLVASDDPPDATRGQRQPTSWGPRALVLAAASGPLWPTWIGVDQFTVGRVMLIVTALGIVVDLVPVRGRVPRPRWGAAALIAALVAYVGWNGVNAATVGCFCGGTFQGTAEVVALTGVAALVALYSAPRWSYLAFAAAATAAGVAGLLSVLGIQDLHANVFSPGGSADRLEGVYGNSNYLGFALALALPATTVGVLRLRSPWRWAAAALGVALAVFLVLTYSRGSLLGAAAGVGVAGWFALPRRPSRRVLIAVAVAIPVVMLGLIASPFYQSQRMKADFGNRAATANGDDLSGWTARGLGPVDVPGAQLSNPPGKDVLRVNATQPGQGVTQVTIKQLQGGPTTWRVTLASTPGRPDAAVRWLVSRADGSVITQGARRTTPAPITVTFGFTGRPKDYVLLYLWVRRASSFDVGPVTYRELPTTTGTVDKTHTLDTRLLGSGEAALHQAERKYIDSRQTGLRLAVRAFKQRPVTGIGLDQFPAFADAHADYGHLPTHDFYAQVLAELGLIGVALLVVAGGVLGILLRRGRPPAPLRAIVLGSMAVGVVNLVFINGQSAPGMTMPLILAMGTAAGWAGKRPSAGA